MVFLDTLGVLISNCDFTDFLVLGGDFNCTADVLDRNHHMGTLQGDIIGFLKALEIEIVALQCLGEATGDQEHITALKRKKAALADLLGITAQGALVRSRFRNVTELDAPSKFFFGLERKNGQKRFMYVVRSESGDLVSEPSEIRQQTVSFFSKLFESEWASCRDVEERFFPLQARIT
ncbi:hypothetical protein SRHO_G00258150 [Serrasalmus rhombeus]